MEISELLAESNTAARGVETRSSLVVVMVALWLALGMVATAIYGTLPLSQAETGEIFGP